MKPSFPAILVLSLTAAGCGKQEPASLAAPSAPTASAPSTMPSLDTGAPVTTTPTTAKEAETEAPPPAIDFASLERPTDEHDRPLSDLELLNQVLFNYNEARATGGNVIQRTYKSEDEQLAAEAAQLQRSTGPVTDLSELVKAGLIKAVPAAPAGKKYAIDPQTHKVVLVNGP